MAKKMFARGYEASRAEKERQDAARENSGKKLWKFFLKNDGDEAEVRFLTEVPINFYEHNIKRGDKIETYVCSGDNCPCCAEGDKPTYKGAFLIVDKREYEYTDSNGKKQKGKNQLRLYVQGMRVVSQLDRISSKYGLSNRDVTIVRLGSGTSTTYTIEKGDDTGKLSRKEIEQLLPEKLRDEYNGTVDSLMDILEEQLSMLTKDYDPSADDEDDEDEEEDDSRSKLVPFDEEDEEEEKKPKKKMFRKSQSSLKKAKDFMR